MEKKNQPQKFKGKPQPFRRDKKKFNKEKEATSEKPKVEGGEEEAKSEDMRLNKYLAHSGICSRRKADELIKKGLVTVNDVVVLEMGYKVLPDDRVRYDGKLVRPRANHVYFLLNKPHNIITTLDDEKGRRTVLDIMQEYTKERVYPVGRLDRNTTGLLLMTNDGDLAQKLSHPKYEVMKVYRATLDKPITEEQLKLIRNTLVLEDGPAPVDEVSFVEGASDRVVGITIHLGRNRIVRRIFEHLGFEVKKLDRVRYAMLTKKNLTVGKCRRLTKEEIIILKHLA